MIDIGRVLFDGRLGTQRARVWLEQRGAGIVLLSHDIGRERGIPHRFTIV